MSVSVMPSAVVLAIHLSKPLKLLYESVGYMQDAICPLDQEGTEAGAVQYINLLSAVIMENANVG